MKHTDDIELCPEPIVHIDIAGAARDAMPEEEHLYDLADLFKNFSDTTRIRILYLLMPGELCVCDIAAALGITQSAASHQLRILKQADLIRNRREGKSILYSLADEHVTTILAKGMEHVLEDA